MSFIKESVVRFQTNMPSYFKKVNRMGIGLSAAGTTLVGATSALPASVHPPAVLGTIGGYMLVAGLVSAGIAKLTVDDPSVLPPKQ